MEHVNSHLLRIYRKGKAFSFLTTVSFKAGTIGSKLNYPEMLPFGNMFLSFDSTFTVAAKG